MKTQSSLHKVLLASALMLPVASAAMADEVVEQIELGLERYQEEDYGSALTELEFAISDIRKLQSARIAETFPEPPEGWEAGNAESSDDGAAAMMGGGAMLERYYSENGGDGELTASIMVDNPMIQGMAALFNNPAMLTAQPNTERVRMGRESAIVTWEPSYSSAEVSLLLDGRILIQVEGTNLASQDTAVELMRSWDIGAVREQVGR
ncbi:MULTISPECIES: hypothetical protein [Halomonadaceae]|uniref:Uncharacterized protein n=1 Tax=Halomonas campaniensis TaxID=213554 RepID=A0A246S1I2_9GAMM|nr:MULTISPECIES: hypothetical protein [Halomonas]MBS3669729.1 hypothetical protein [Halomonas boliviensis]OWV30284.1 hypothetical protein JI62_07795 [Halomonas campaniensis]